LNCFNGMCGKYHVRKRERKLQSGKYKKKKTIICRKYIIAFENVENRNVFKSFCKCFLEN